AAYRGPAGASLIPVWLPAARQPRVRPMSDQELSKLAVIVGSVREGRFGPVAAAWIAGLAGQHGGFEVDVIDLAGFDIPVTLPPDSPKHAGDAYPRPLEMR